MQSFILDRHTDPSNPTMKVTQDDKIPIYDSLADAQADIANIEEGQIGMTKDTGAEFPNLQEYVRNQNILDDWEPTTVSSDSSNPTVMPYDGFLYVSASGLSTSSIQILYVYVNGTRLKGNGSDIQAQFNNYSYLLIPVKKGDEIYVDYTNVPYNKETRVRYYKLRDYTGR